MRRSHHTNGRPEQRLEVEVAWIVEDSPEGHAAWRRLWRFILDWLEKQDPTSTNAPHGEQEASDDRPAWQPDREEMYEHPQNITSLHPRQAPLPPHRR
jgi:hypothetical protein